MHKGRIGIIIIISVLTIWIVDRTTESVSTVLGKLICGDRYMQPVSGIVGDLSCGFNIDMYLTLILTIVLILGIVLYVRSKKSLKKKFKHEKKYFIWQFTASWTPFNFTARQPVNHWFYWLRRYYISYGGEWWY